MLSALDLARRIEHGELPLAAVVGACADAIAAQDHPHDDLEVIAVEVGAPQLAFVHSISPVASVCLNVADDHIDHFGTLEEYVATKARIYERTQEAAVYNVQDPETLRMVEDADVVEGCRAIGFTLGTPGPSMLGIVDDLLGSYDVPAGFGAPISG